MQIMLRKPVARAFLENQRQTNRMTAQGYTAWDNVFAGNRYNLRLWLAGFKQRLRDALRAQIWAIMTREGLSSASGIIGLGIIFVAIVMVAVRNTGDMEVLVVLAATLPRQIEMTKDMYSLASGWNDMVAVWARLGGVVDSMRPDADPDYDARIKYDWLILREGDETHHVSSLEDALKLVYSKPNGRINVRGRNGAGKSTVLAALKSEIKNRAYYWPTTDRLAFKFAEGIDPEGDRGRGDRSGTAGRGGRNRAAADAEENRVFLRRTPAQVAAGNHPLHRCVGLSVRRMGRQPRHQQPRAGR